MQIKSLHIIWLLYGLVIAGYALYYHSSEKLQKSDAGGRFAGIAGFFLVILVIGTLAERFKTKK